MKSSFLPPMRPAQQKMVEDSVGRGLKRDVLPLKPTAVTIKFGMNDHSYQKFREDIFKAYVRSQSELAKVLEANGARVAFLTPQPIEDKRPDPDKDVRNQSLRQFSDGLKEVAAKQGATFVDQFDPYMAIMLRERAADPAAHHRRRRRRSPRSRRPHDYGVGHLERARRTGPGLAGGD